MTDILITKGYQLSTMEGVSDLGRKWMVRSLVGVQVSFQTCTITFLPELLEDYIEKFEENELRYEIR